MPLIITVRVAPRASRQNLAQGKRRQQEGAQDEDDSNSDQQTMRVEPLLLVQRGRMRPVAGNVHPAVHTPDTTRERGESFEFFFTCPFPASLPAIEAYSNVPACQSK